MIALLGHLAELRGRAIHGETMRATFERVLSFLPGGDLIALRRELDALRQAVDRALVDESRAVRRRILSFEGDGWQECPEDCPKCNFKADEILSDEEAPRGHDWGACGCAICSGIRRRFETQYEGGRG